MGFALLILSLFSQISHGVVIILSHRDQILNIPNFHFHTIRIFKVTAHSNNRNSKSSREVILGSVRLRQSVILRNYDMFSTDSNARYTARW